MHIGPGHPYPLGAAWDGAGVNFMFSAHATGVDLCLFDTRRRVPMSVWPAARRLHR